MVKKVWITFLFCTAQLLSAAWGAEKPFNWSLDWKSTVEQTTQGNPEYRAARESLRSAEFTRRRAYSGFFPQVATSLGYTHGTGKSTTSDLLTGTTSVV